MATESFFNPSDPLWDVLLRFVYNLAVLFIIMIVFAYIKMREQNLRNEKLVLELRVKQRTEEVVLKNAELNQKNEKITAQRDEIEIQRDYLVEMNKNLNLKNEEIQMQRDEIEEQRDEIEIQVELLAKYKKETSASIVYASRIQQAILPAVEDMSSVLSNYFILYMPRDIVSGDFFWFKHVKNLIYIAAADCTGHGVPGAFMSMLGTALLNEIVTRRYLNPPNLILNELRKRIKKSLHQDKQTSQTQDGIDISLCLIDLENCNVQYAGANCSAYIYRKNSAENKIDFIELKGDRMPIGIYPLDYIDFKTKELNIIDGDRLYIFSDGYVSQFGGEFGDKFKTNRFQQTLMQIQDKTMTEQKDALAQILTDWQGKNEQVDDILVIGVQLL